VSGKAFCPEHLVCNEANIKWTNKRKILLRNFKISLLEIVHASAIQHDREMQHFEILSKVETSTKCDI
jgi:hypothetical protein